MSKLEKAIDELNRPEQTEEQCSPLHTLDARAKLLVTLLFLLTVLSIPLTNLSTLILFTVYPVVSCAMAGIRYGIIFKRSLIVLPFILLIGIFNPLLDRQVMFYWEGVGITYGWITFVSILIRGLISVQAVFVLIFTTGFYNLCRGMGHLGISSLLITQLLFVYRYISVLLQEALNMSRARTARSFGRKSYPVKMWGIFIGQLLIRTIERSERIHRAMLSRGFTGTIHSISSTRWRLRDTLYLLSWAILFLIVRLCHPAGIFNVFINS